MAASRVHRRGDDTAGADALIKHKARQHGLPGLAGAGRPRRPGNQTENEDPQPQVVEALGLRMTNWEPDRSSL